MRGRSALLPGRSDEEPDDRAMPVHGEQGVPGAPELEVTHLNLNDGTVEGIRHRSLPIFAVQYHPEAAPGPHDAYPHFAEFLEAIRRSASVGAPAGAPTP